MAVAVLSLLVGVAGACGGGESAEVDTTDQGCPDDGGAGPYYVSDTDGFELRSASDVSPSDPIRDLDPTIDWYVELERFRPVGEGTVLGEDLRISGHEAALEDHGEELRGFDVEEQTVGGRPALVGKGPDGPAVTSMGIEDGYTVMLLSYGLEPESLVTIAADLRQVCHDNWGELTEPTTSTTTSTSLPPMTTTTGPLDG